MENIEWVGQFKAYDDERHPETIRVGIVQEGEGTVGIYFDDDSLCAEAYVNDRKAALDYIEKEWGKTKTFRWLPKCELTHINVVPTLTHLTDPVEIAEHHSMCDSMIQHVNKRFGG